MDKINVDVFQMLGLHLVLREFVLFYRLHDTITAAIRLKLLRLVNRLLSIKVFEMLRDESQ